MGLGAAMGMASPPVQKCLVLPDLVQQVKGPQTDYSLCIPYLFVRAYAAVNEGEELVSLITLGLGTHSSAAAADADTRKPVARICSAKPCMLPERLRAKSFCMNRQ